MSEINHKLSLMASNKMIMNTILFVGFLANPFFVGVGRQAVFLLWEWWELAGCEGTMIKGD